MNISTLLGIIAIPSAVFFQGRAVEKTIQILDSANTYKHQRDSVVTENKKLKDQNQTVESLEEAFHNELKGLELQKLREIAQIQKQHPHLVYKSTLIHDTLFGVPQFSYLFHDSLRKTFVAVKGYQYNSNKPGDSIYQVPELPKPIIDHK